MIRRFYITMFQKGKFNELRNSEIKQFITFQPTDKKQIQIVEIDEAAINKYDEDRREQELRDFGICKSAPFLDYIYDSILGISHYSGYKYRSALREILPEDIKEDYKAIKSSFIEKESEKAYFIKGLDSWIPKSQCVKDDNILYIKRWLFFKNLF